MSKKIFLSLIIVLCIILLNTVRVDAVSEVPGDINLDGIVTKADNSLLIKYIRGRVDLSRQALINADVYQDGNVNMADLEVLIKHNSQSIKVFEVLPYVPLKGDVNFDGIIDICDASLINKHIVNNGYYNGCRVLNDAQLYNADVYQDGEIDMADMCIISRVDAELMDNLPYKPVKGDMDFNGKFDIEDIKIFRDIIKNDEELDEAQKRNADSLIGYVIDNYDLIMNALKYVLMCY